MVTFGAALFSLGSLGGALLQHMMRRCPSRRTAILALASAIVQAVAFITLPLGIVKLTWMLAELPIGFAVGLVWWRQCRG